MSRPSLLGSLRLVVGLCTIMSSVGQNASCSICPGPADGITQPDRVVTLPGYDSTSCGTLAVFIPLVLTQEDPECEFVQSVSSICGCPYREDACYLCPNKASQSAGTLEIAYSNEYVQTCELLEAFLRSTSSESDTCREGQAFAQECGCPPQDETRGDQDENLTSHVPTTTPVVEIPSNNEQCTLCRDDAEMLHPDADISFLIEALIENYLSGVYIYDGDIAEVQAVLDSLQALEGPVTCQFTDTILGQLFSTDEEFCIDSQSYFGGVCGCPPVDNPCIFCPNDEAIPLPDTVFYPTEDLLNYAATCQTFSDMMTQVSGTSDTCWEARILNFICGCNEGKRDYFGTGASDARKAALSWIPRLTGLLSVIGSTTILWDIFRDPQKRRGSVYHELIVGLSVFDIVGSIAWMFSTLPSPAYFPEYGGVSSGIFGARGDYTTCKTQGFFMELSYIGSTSYNLALTVYFLNVIVRNKRERDLQRMRPFLHVPPLLLALGLAFGGIPYYQSINVACQVVSPPAGDSWTPIIVFGLAPVFTIIFFCCLNMTIIYLHVRKLNQAARKWRFSNAATRGNTKSSSETNSSNKVRSVWKSIINNRSMTNRRQSLSAGDTMERKVFWQAVFYMVVFAITWSSYLVGQINSKSESFAFWTMLVILTPLQGALNALVYFRTRYMSYLRRKRREREATRKARHQERENRRQEQAPAEDKDTQEQKQNQDQECPTDVMASAPERAQEVEKARENNTSVFG